MPDLSAVERQTPDWACGPIRISVRAVSQLFSTIDPSPFVERDLNNEVEDFIIGWARDLKRGAKLELEVEVTAPQADGDGEAEVAKAVRLQFQRRADTRRRELGELLRRGRISLLIGALFLASCVLLSDRLPDLVHARPRLVSVLQQGLTVAGWVAMWRPMEIFLYLWWPLVGDRRLYRMLVAMPVRVRFAPTPITPAPRA